MSLNNLTDQIDELMRSKTPISNDDLVQLIEHTGGYLNLRTIPDYAKENGLSYNGVKKHRTVKIIFNTKFVIDNN